MMRDARTTALKALLLALSLGASTGALRAQDPRYVLWTEPETDSCVQGGLVKVRVLLEIRQGATPVKGWVYGVCHDPELFELVDVQPGQATKGVCNGQDALAVETEIFTNLNPAGFVQQALLSSPDVNCTLPPGCPYELAVATYRCRATLNGLQSLICVCNDLGDLAAIPARIILGNLEQTDPTLVCGPHECQDRPPGRKSCDCTGTEFWLAFPGTFVPEPDMPKDLRLLIASEPGATGQIQVPGIGFVKNFTVPPNSSIEQVVPHAAELGRDSDVITDLGVRVVADNAIQVHGMNNVAYTVDGFLGLPVELLGTEYIVLGYKNVYGSGAGETLNGSKFAIVATENGTQLDITPSVSTDGHPAGVAYSITLDRGFTYQLSNHDDAFADLTGTLIKSTRPVAVFGGHFCATVPQESVFFCNYNVEQLPPAALWGQAFAAMPLQTRTNGDTFRILARDDGTSIQVNGAGVGVINRGEVFEYEPGASAPVLFAATRPVLVAQHARGSLHDGVTDADSSMMLLPPVTQFKDRYIFRTPADHFDSFNFVNIITPPAGVGTIQLDGAPIPAGSYSAGIGGSALRGAQVPITAGVTHVLSGPVDFGANWYGFDDRDAYSFPACFSFDGRDGGSTPTQVTRSIEHDPCGGNPARVTLSTSQGRSAVTVVERFPECAVVVDVSDGGVVGNGTVTFQIGPGFVASYSLEPKECCAQGAPVGVRIDGTIVDDGPCDRGVSGGDTVPCCGQGTPCDTHCTGLDVNVEGNKVSVFAGATDDSGDPISYTFEFSDGVNTITVGPQAENSTEIELPPGNWTVKVTVSDGTDCDPPARDSMCQTTIVIQGRPCDTHCLGLDVNVEGTKVDIAAGATDDSGDPPLYLFEAMDAQGNNVAIAGPQPGSSASTNLPPGTWTIKVTVSDGSDCSPPAQDSMCTTTVEIVRDRPLFSRGDANGDNAVNISDAQYTLNYLFLGGPGFVCSDAADANGDGATNISDAQYVLNYLFLGGPAPPEPVGCSSATSGDPRLGCSKPVCP